MRETAGYRLAAVNHIFCIAIDEQSGDLVLRKAKREAHISSVTQAAFRTIRSLAWMRPTSS